MQQTKINRYYGIHRTMGDILYNHLNKTVVAYINAGFFGKVALTLKRLEDGGFELLKSYKDRQGVEQIIRIGRTFPAKDKNGNPVEGITKGTLGLFNEYDQELQKELPSSRDCLLITTHKLKEPKVLGDGSWKKIGYLTGQYAIEIANSAEIPIVYDTVEEVDEEEIPF